LKPYKFALWSLLALAATELPAQAAWNNVFQPTCFGRSRSSSSGYGGSYCQSCAPVVAQYAAPVMAQYVPPAPACNTCNSPPPIVVQAPPPPVQQCTTNYVQRSYYQPVTSYESRSYYEPVSTMQTSYYYEAVTNYQTSYYPDPCNCGYVAKSTPVTAYQLKQQSCPVQSWVQRCAQVPVTSYKQMYYMEPQTTCCNTTPGCPNGACQTPGACANGACQGASPQAPAYQQPQQPAYQQQQQPAYQQQQQPAYPAPQTPSYSAPPVIDQPRPAPSGPSVGSMSGYGYHPMKTASAWQPVVTLAAIAPEKNDGVQGQVVRSDRTPTTNANVLFVNATTGDRHSITTNNAGRFNVALTSGSYHVFLASSNGTAAYHSLVNVTPNQPINLINN